MPTQEGNIIVKGTIGNNTYYKMNGRHLARKKTSLNKERVLTDPAFKRSRAASTNFAKASKLAGEVYRQLPARFKKPGMIGKLTGAAVRLLYEGYKIKEVKLKLPGLYK